MERRKIPERLNKNEALKDLGFEFSVDYWKEDACYVFSSKEIETIEKAIKKCYAMYINAVQYVIDKNLWDKLHIPAKFIPIIVDSWNSDELSLYGRFDFAFVNGVPKLLEFNADTPTSLYEAAIVQWNWKTDVYPKNDQYNNMHEMLVESWKTIGNTYNAPTYHFSCILDNLEDATTTAYIMSTASEADLNVSIMDMEEIKLLNDTTFADENDNNLDVLFKLYPYEWMFNEEFGDAILTCETTFIEPLWKAIMSNKYMLVILAELFPDSPYILKASELQGDLKSFCKKPIYSREGANITLVKDGVTLIETEGEYGEEGFIYQELVDVPSFDNRHPIIGGWVIGGEASGIGIRETEGLITDNMANFVPHILE